MPRLQRAPRVLVILSLTLVLATTVAGTFCLWWSTRPDDRDAPVLPAPGASATAAATPAPTWTPRPGSIHPLRILDYPHFTIGYDEQAKNPAWVAYALDGPIRFRERLQRPATFATEFRTAAHVAHRDYNHSGFDRGHLCPAYAMASRHGAEAMRATFVMSNVLPQYHGLNAGEWETLESAIAGREREGDGWAARHGPLWIINGPVYDARPATRMLRNGTWIPTACFSVVLRQQDGRWEALAFSMPNQPQVDGPISRHLTSIHAIARATGLDLLAGLDGKEALAMRWADTLWR